MGRLDLWNVLPEEVAALRSEIEGYGLELRLWEQFSASDQIININEVAEERGEGNEGEEFAVEMAEAAAEI